jgi:hypothetical protein
MKFVLLVEGDTEKEAAAAFLKRWLDPQLGQRVGVQVVRFNGWAEMARKLEGNVGRNVDLGKESWIVTLACNKFRFGQGD